jgi:hypothetical protein
MLLKELINKSYYGVISYISSLEDIDKIEQYINYNLPILKEFTQILIATNYSTLELTNNNHQLWKKYFPNCIMIDSKINRGHNHGNADLDNMLFDFCKNNNIKWLCKSAIDTILQENILTKEIEEADFYYLDGISYEDLYLNNFDHIKILDYHFHPQTNFYIMDISKCDYLNDKNYLDITFEQIKNIPNYNGKIWEYIDGWSCEGFLRKCVERNNLKKYYLIKDKHNKLCDVIKMYKIGDPSHKNILIDGVCHYHYQNQNILEI